jgi:hypothetical protein
MGQAQETGNVGRQSGDGWVIIAQQRYRTVVRRRTKSKTESSSRRRGRDIHKRAVGKKEGMDVGWVKRKKPAMWAVSQVRRAPV